MVDSVVWYFPNLLNYVRMLFLILIFTTIKTRPVLTFVLVLIAGLIDDFDGLISREYKLTSKLGAVMDIGIDRLTTAIQLFFLASKWPKFYFVFMIFLFTEMFADYTGGVESSYSAQILKQTGETSSEKVKLKIWLSSLPIVWYTSDLFYWILYFAAFIPRQNSNLIDENNNSYHEKTIPVHLLSQTKKQKAGFLDFTREKCLSLLDICDKIGEFIESQINKSFPSLKPVLVNVHLKVILKSIGVICCIGAFLKFYGNLARMLESIFMIIQSDDQLKEFNQKQLVK